MDERATEEEEPLTSRIERLQHERDELRKDIEQLCMQQAGPGYLAVATRMHFQRTAGLEQEIESLRKKLAVFAREKQNLQEELSEAYRIKTQLADLHSAEVLKNKEAENQLKFFQTCVGAAFAERDHSLLEYEKAKEMEEAMSQRLVAAETRVEELQSAYLDEKNLNARLQMELVEQKEQIEIFEKVMNKFYEIRERDADSYGDNTWQEKCSLLLDDPLDKWVFSSDSTTSTSKYIASLEELLEKQKKSIDKLQSNLRMGLEIERHLKRNLQTLEKKQTILVDSIKNGLSALRNFYNQQRFEVMKILEEEASQIKSVLIEIQTKLAQIHIDYELKFEVLQREHQQRWREDAEYRDVHITSDVVSDVPAKRSDLSTETVLTVSTPESDALAQALQEKVSALLLLSQQEERHLLERDVNQALQRKLEELQRNLSQVTSEKVKVLMELAHLKREYELLQEDNSYGMRQSNSSDDGSDKSIIVHGQEGKLKNLLKRTYLNRWIRKGHNEHDVDAHANTDESSSINKKNSVDFARLKVEHAALQESLANLEHLTSSIHKFHALLLKAQDDAKSAGPSDSIAGELNSIIAETKHVKTAIGSSLPISWSADAALDATTYESLYESEECKRLDVVSAAGLEMVELLMLAAQFLQDSLARRNEDGKKSIHSIQDVQLPPI